MGRMVDRLLVLAILGSKKSRAIGVISLLIIWEMCARIVMPARAHTPAHQATSASAVAAAAPAALVDRDLVTASRQTSLDVHTSASSLGCAAPSSHPHTHTPRLPRPLSPSLHPTPSRLPVPYV
eukprot:226709-Chlamydomonas_euryale.AAC.7